MIGYKCWAVLDFYKEPLVLKNKLAWFQFQLDTSIVNSIFLKKENFDSNFSSENQSQFKLVLPTRDLDRWIITS
jgi:hypothetical protein